jgi:prepilin-type N-terminal cleavage/methylation domain-containing protein
MKKGFSIIELLVVMAVIAILVGLAIPAINAMQKSFASTGAEGMIGTALSTARTLAISRGQYAGVRFQKAGDPNNALKANQYMIFIIYDEDMSTLSDEFRAIEGYKPIKLPENMGIIDMNKITKDSDIISDPCVIDATAFSIIFSPAGKLVIHDVQTRNKDGEPNGYTDSNDMVFNTLEKITLTTDPAGQFVQDDYPNLGLDKEQSRNQFVIYDCEKFGKLGANKRYTNYLKNLKFIYINAYTGEIIK